MPNESGCYRNKEEGVLIRIVTCCAGHLSTHRKFFTFIKSVTDINSFHINFKSLPKIVDMFGHFKYNVSAEIFRSQQIKNHGHYRIE